MQFVIILLQILDRLLALLEPLAQSLHRLLVVRLGFLAALQRFHHLRVFGLATGTLGFQFLLQLEALLQLLLRLGHQRLLLLVAESVGLARQVLLEQSQDPIHQLLLADDLQLLGLPGFAYQFRGGGGLAELIEVEGDIGQLLIMSGHGMVPRRPMEPQWTRMDRQRAKGRVPPLGARRRQ